MSPGRDLLRRVAEVARVSGKLGLIGFGGPAAHVGVLRVELVERRPWVTDDDGVSAAAVGLMGAVGVVLAGKALVDPLTVVTAVAVLVVLDLTRLNTASLVPAGAAIGALHSL